MQRQPRTVADRKNVAEEADEAHCRKEGVPRPDRAKVRLDVLLAGLLEPALFGALFGEGFDQRQPVQVLLKTCVDFAESVARLAVDRLNTHIKIARQEEDDADRKERNQPEPYIQPDQNPGDNEETEQVSDDRIDALKTELLQHIDVAHRPRGQVADAIVAEVGERLPLQFGIDGIAQVEDEPLADALEDDPFDGVQQRCQPLNCEHQQQRGHQHSDALLHDHDIDDVFPDQRVRRAERCRDQQQNDPEHDLFAVWAQVGEQAAQDIDIGSASDSGGLVGLSGGIQGLSQNELLDTNRYRIRKGH